MNFKRTKIVSTIGPASADYKTLKALALSGMDIVRLNFSHGTLEEKIETIHAARKISSEIGKDLTIFADLPGPKMRLGSIDGKRDIKRGDHINMAINPIEDELPIQFDLSSFVKKNQRIFLNDGLVELKVQSIRGKVINTIAQNNGWVSSNKGVNIPDTNIKGGAFTDKDREFAEASIKEGVDYIALSFVQTSLDIKPLREMIKKLGAKTQIISKIETLEATNNLEEIIKDSDAVMVARGDLAIETRAADVPIVQQKIIEISRQYQKPVIVATQMLESMIENPRPTRAEVSDVANAVLDQVDCVMLSAETASGKYPVETVKEMNDIIVTVEKNPDYNNYIGVNLEAISPDNLSYSAIAESAAILAETIQAKAIIVSTASGRTARLLSSFRPQSSIFAATYDTVTNNQLNMVWGVHSFTVEPTNNFSAFLTNVTTKINRVDKLSKGDKLVVITGSSIGKTGLTDTIKVINV